MRDNLGGELLFALGICVAGGNSIFIWRAHPVVAMTLMGVFAIGAAWVGYRIETFLHPVGGRLRGVIVPATYSVVAVVGAFLLWAAYCPCV